MADDDSTADQPARLVQAFIENEGMNIHRALGVDAHFDMQRAQYVPNAPFYELKEILQIYQGVAKPPLEFDLHDCTWETVLDQMDKAAGEYRNRGRNFAKQAERKLGDVAVVIMPVLEMIPDDNGLSVLHGGLAILFSAARYRAECRQKILRSFGDIPDVLERAHRQRSIFPSDMELKRGLDGLYESLIAGITEMVASLLPNSIIGKLKKPFHNSTVDSALEAIQRNVKSVDSIVEALIQRDITQTRHIVQSSERQLQAIRHTTKMSEIDVRNLTKQFEEVKEYIQEIREQTLAVNGINAFFNFFMDCIDGKERQLQREHASQHPGLSQRNDPLISISELLAILAVPHVQATRDLECVLKRSSDFDSDSLGQARHLVQTAEFRDWLYSSRSEMLAVEASLDCHHTDKVSPISVISATLSLAAWKLQPAMVIQFFCGQHTEVDDRLRGPHGLLRSLLNQLLLQPDTWSILSLDFIDNLRYLDDVQVASLDALCDVLMNVILQLPPDMVVFCIVDGISWFEQHEWLDDLDLILGHLSMIVNDPRPAPSLKVLFTTTGRNSVLQSWLPESQCLSLRRQDMDTGVISERAIL